MCNMQNDNLGSMHTIADKKWCHRCATIETEAELDISNYQVTSNKVGLCNTTWTS